MSRYLDDVRAEIDKRLGWTPQHAVAEAWDHAVTTALEFIGPVLEGWDQRLADVQAEYAKSLESWDRTRERLTSELAKTRGKLGEAQGNHWAAREENELLRREVEFEANAMDTYYIPGSLCACVPDTEAAALVDAGWSLPQCTVHPESGDAE